MFAKKYWLLAKLTFSEYAAYRLNFALETWGAFLLLIATLLFWRAAFAEQANIGNYNIAEITTYLLGIGLLNSFILLTSQGDEVEEDIHYGRLSTFLLKPINTNFLWFVRDFCRKNLTLVLGLSVFLIFFFIFRHQLLPPQNSLFIIFVFLAAILHFLLFHIFSLVAFWMSKAGSARFVLRILMLLATGQLAPLHFFPMFWQKLFLLLPFKFFGFVPMEIYLGKINNIPQVFLEGFLWVFVFVLVIILLWRKGIKTYEAPGI